MCAVLLVAAAACSEASTSTTVLTGPNGERWDAQEMVGNCFLWETRIEDAPCSDPSSSKAIFVGHSDAECPAESIGSWTWPAQGPNPSVVVCFA